MFIRAPMSAAPIGLRANTPRASFNAATAADVSPNAARLSASKIANDACSCCEPCDARPVQSRNQRRVNVLLVRHQMRQLPIAERFFHQRRIGETWCWHRWRQRRSFPRTTCRPWHSRPPPEPTDPAQTGRRPSAGGPTRHAPARPAPASPRRWSRRRLPHTPSPTRDQPKPATNCSAERDAWQQRDQLIGQGVVLANRTHQFMTAANGQRRAADDFRRGNRHHDRLLDDAALDHGLEVVDVPLADQKRLWELADHDWSAATFPRAPRP